MFYAKRKDEVWKEDIVAFLDNSAEKQQKEFDGRMVYKPEKIVELEYDYIVLMGKKKFESEMLRQLQSIGIEKEKILTYEEFCIMKEPKGMQIYYEREWTGLCSKGKNVLLLSHELSSTGAPIVLLNVALVMKKNGYNPVIMSPVDGPLRQKIVDQGITVVVERVINKNNKFLWEWMVTFDFIWVNTLSFCYLIDDLAETNVPAAWWIHETDISYEIIGMDSMPKKNNRIPVYGVGKRAIESYEKYLNNKNIKNLFYGLPDAREEKRLTFALIGTISERKGQDIFVEAIEMLTEEQRKKAVFQIIGGIVQQYVYDDVVARSKRLSCLSIVGEVSHETMLQMYKNIDVVVCPSRMDPMPVVITEGLMNNKICIASEATGSAGLITDGKNGFVCETNAQSLAEKMGWIIDHKDEMDNIREEARKVYEENFSMNIFEENVLKIIESI